MSDKTPEGNSQIPGPMSALSGKKTTPLVENGQRNDKTPTQGLNASNDFLGNSALKKERNLLLLIISGIISVGLIIGGIIIFTSFSSGNNEDIISSESYISPQKALESAIEKQNIENTIVNPYLEIGTLKAEMQQELVDNLNNVIPSDAIQITDRVALGVAMIKPTTFYFDEKNISAEEFSTNMLNSLPNGWTVIDSACYPIGQNAGLTNLYNAATVFTNAVAAQSCPSLIDSPEGESYAIWAYSNADSSKVLDPDLKKLDGSNPGNVGVILPGTGVLIIASWMDLINDNTGPQMQETPGAPTLAPQASPQSAP